MPALPKLKGPLAAACLLTLLAGCNGGGSSSSTSSTSASGSAAGQSLPASGSFTFAIKAAGSPSAPTMGFSLVHPSAPGIEFEIEPATARMTELKEVSTAAVNGATASVSNVVPYALLYIVNGDVRSVPLVADGTNPATRVSKAGTTDACTIVVEANNYSDPTKSRWVVSTKGVDGVCGTSDDGQGEARLDSAGVVHYTAKLTGVWPYKVLGMLRDPDDLAPAGWIYGDNVSFIGEAIPTISVLRSSAQPKLTRVVAASYKAALAEYNNQLTLLNVVKSGGKASIDETILDPTLTAGTGWESIGFDKDNFYVYRNTGTIYTASTGTWSVLKISRAAPAATLLASGSGYLGTAAMGSNVLFATVINYSGNRLLTLNKLLPGTPHQIESTVLSTLPTVLASSSTTHMLWRTTNAGTASQSFSIDMIDEAGNKLYSASGAMPMWTIDDATRSLNRDRAAATFIFVKGFGSRAMADATLMAYKAATQTPVVLGQLPGSAIFGSDPVYANVLGGTPRFVAGYAARISGGTIQTSGAKVFTVDPEVSNSLQYTTSTR